MPANGELDRSTKSPPLGREIRSHRSHGRDEKDVCLRTLGRLPVVPYLFGRLALDDWILVGALVPALEPWRYLTSGARSSAGLARTHLPIGRKADTSDQSGTRYTNGGLVLDVPALAPEQWLAQRSTVNKAQPERLPGLYLPHRASWRNQIATPAYSQNP